MSASLYSKLVSAAPMWLKESVHAEKKNSIKTTFFFSSLHDHTSRAMMIMTAWLYCRLRRIHPMLWRHLDNPSVSKMFHEHFYHSPFDLIRWLQYSARSISQFPECPSEMNKLILTEMNNFEFEENDSSEIYGGEKKKKEISSSGQSPCPWQRGESSASVSFHFRWQKEKQFSTISQTMTDTFKSSTDEQHGDDGTQRQF